MHLTTKSCAKWQNFWFRFIRVRDAPNYSLSNDILNKKPYSLPCSFACIGNYVYGGLQMPRKRDMDQGKIHNPTFGFNKSTKINKNSNI